MVKRHELFGHPIVNHRQLTYARQIYEILVEEIHNGRWKIGKRLPGVIAICRQACLGNKTIQDAFRMLKEDGYVQAEPYKGTFLVSLLPQGIESSKGRIGILLSKERASDPYSLWISHIFMEALRLRGMVGEVRIVNPEQDDMYKVIGRSGPFSKEVTAIISLIPFHLKPRFEMPGDTIPTLFFSAMSEECRPLLAVDVERGYYELTRRVICAGHSRVAFFADQKKDPKITELCRRGCLQAMQENGLRPVEYALTHNDAKKTGKVFLKLVADAQITAIVSGSLALVQNLFLLSDFSAMVPSKISLVSVGAADRMPGETLPLLTGISLNFDHMVHACFDLLNEMINTGMCRRDRVLIAPDFVQGETLRAVNGFFNFPVNEPSVPTITLYSNRNFSAAMNG